MDAPSFLVSAAAAAALVVGFPFPFPSTGAVLGPSPPLLALLQFLVAFLISTPFSLHVPRTFSNHGATCVLQSSSCRYRHTLTDCWKSAVHRQSVLFQSEVLQIS